MIRWSRSGRLGAALGFLVAGLAPAAAVDYLNNTVQADRAIPTACLQFSAPLPRGDAQAQKPFVAVTPPGDFALESHGRDLCVTGLKRGGRYAIRLKAGLPAGDGTVLPKDVTVDLTVPDREARLGFDGNRTLLPYDAAVGLPLRSVNVGKAHLTVYRFGERALAELATQDWFRQGLTGYSLGQVAERGTKLFEGAVLISGKPNADTVTALPIDTLLEGIKPGVYVAVAVPDGSQPDDDADRATQWFSVSDLGLVTVKTDGGMLVSVRSLKSALPVPNIELRLIARSNEVLASLTTDADGRATVPAGLLRGENGDAARLLTASSQRGDFTLLPVDDPALDLSDLDLKGRTPPGPLDAYLWSDRGIYRPGETLHLGALLRDKAAALTTQGALTIHLIRPDGIEVDHLPLTLDHAGGGTLNIRVPDNAYSGAWTVWAGIAGKDQLGSLGISVQDFVPPRLDAKLDVPTAHLDAGAPVTADVAADYFYGSPGAGLSGQVEATIAAAAQPFAGFQGFRFGLEQEPVLPKALEAQSFTTDDKGRASVTFPDAEAPDTTAPLEVRLAATVNDVDGRPATAEATRPLHKDGPFIGLRAQGGTVGENADAGFELVTLDGDGKPLAGLPLTWDLVLEDYTYNTFFRDGRWQSEEVVNDAKADGGTATAGADGRTQVMVHVKSGRYRLEVYTADGKAATSLRFGAGWWGQTAADNRKPEVLPVTVDAASPPGTVRARIETAFAGRVLAMLDGGGLHGVQELDLPKGGGTVSFAAADVPAAGAYVLAVAVSPAGAVVPRLPVRAVGAAWVAGTAAAHKLDVALEVPAKIAPKTHLDVPVTVADAPAGQPVTVTVAAVDEAVLRMTDFASPDPAEHFVGRREPGIEWRDVYGDLIDPAGQAGRLVEGGDARATKQMGGLDVKTFKTVALFSGPVTLDASGRGTVGLDVPEFSGKLRLMAVAWTADRFGHAEASLLVRPPLLVELGLPRFLAPGDKASVRVMLTDLEAAEQTYAVTLTTDGPLAFDRADVNFKDVKRDKRRFADRTLTATGGLGAGRIHVSVKGDDGTVADRDYDLGVRTPNPYVTTRQIQTVAAGATLTAGDALGAEMLPGTATLDLSVATIPAFDVPGLYADLRRYPYECAEQTVSRAFPELYAARLGATPAPALAGVPTAQGAIARLFSLQASDGSFGYWTAFDGGNVWLTAYAVDFLQRAEAQKLSVPEGMKARALGWLAGRFAAAGAAPADVAGSAYAAVVLARAGKLDTSQLRYLAVRDEGTLPSDIARVQFAAALTHVGERELAARFIAAKPVGRAPKTYLNDYGSDFRDRAMALALAGEEKLLPSRTLLERVADLSRAASGQGYLSTQEEAWLLRTAAAIAGKPELNVTLNGRTVTKRSRAQATIPLGAGRDLTVANAGSDPVYASLATTGVPVGAPPAEAKGFTVSRSLFHLDGSAVDLADVRQNDTLVAVVEGNTDTEVQRKVLLVDMLPAGLEPDTVGLSGSEDTGSLAWLNDLTPPTFTAVRDDRYLAGFDLDGSTKNFKVAYVMRAVTPGSYARPGPQVEDMYAPAYHARGEAGTLEVKTARKPKSP